MLINLPSKTFGAAALAFDKPRAGGDTSNATAFENCGAARPSSAALTAPPHASAVTKAVVHPHNGNFRIRIGLFFMLVSLCVPVLANGWATQASRVRGLRRIPCYGTRTLFMFFPSRAAATLQPAVRRVHGAEVVRKTPATSV
jgi:hypothetical protein